MMYISHVNQIVMIINLYANKVVPVKTDTLGVGLENVYPN